MRQYIVNLTDHLIARNKYGVIAGKITDPFVFMAHVKLDLEAGDVRSMSPEKLGAIMSEFEIGDVMLTSRQIHDAVGFNGDCEDFLRSLVALCLASVIADRLSPATARNVPPWRGGGRGDSDGFKCVIDDIARARRG